MLGHEKSTKEKIRQYLLEHHTAVVATVNRAYNPETSTIFYVAEKGGTIRFITKNQTAKFNNIVANQAVSLTINVSGEPISVTVKGEASIIDDQNEADDTAQAIMAKAQEVLNDIAPIAKLIKGQFVAIKIKPVEIIYSDYSGQIGSGEYVEVVSQPQ